MATARVDRVWRLWVLLALAGLPPAARALASPPRPEQNVILVLLDGVRWQEVFMGADAALLNKELGGITDAEPVRRDYWRDTPETRRQALMPFTWGTVARRGQVLGNRNRNCPVQVANPHWFSYPGWSEMAVGFVEPRIDSNEAGPNPNPTVLEWLHRKPAFRGRVAAFSGWDTGAAILNRDRAGFYVNAGFEPVADAEPGSRLALLNQLRTEVPSPWGCMHYDAVVFHSALEYMTRHKPRVFYIALGETDEFAHEGKYAGYLRALRLADDLLRQLWEKIESMPEYRGRTTLLIATDHGRGEAAEWKSHGAKIAGSGHTWIAAIGPRVPPAGERSNAGPFTTGQVAASLAGAVGEDYAGAVSRAAGPIQGLLSP
jgi:hypothetical protein